MAQASTSAFHEFAQEVRAEIEAALQEYTEFDEDCPPRLREAIRHSVLAPGKRLRPMLVLMAAEACGGARGPAMPAAAAVEMVHTYSLIHDDLPAMDDDALRRGRPACHAVYGEAMAILAGDALLARALEIAAREVHPPSLAAACCAELARAAGASALVGGQVDDLESEFSPGDVQLLERIHRRKTGALISVSLRMGGLVAGADPPQLACLGAYGAKLGLAFQIIDDLLDIQGDEKALGKRVGKDSGRGKATFPQVLGAAQSRARAEELAAEACAALEPLGSPSVRLQALAHYVVNRNR